MDLKITNVSKSTSSSEAQQVHGYNLAYATWLEAYAAMLRYEPTGDENCKEEEIGNYEIECFTAYTQAETSNPREVKEMIKHYLIRESDSLEQPDIEFLNSIARNLDKILDVMVRNRGRKQTL